MSEVRAEVSIDIDEKRRVWVDMVAELPESPEDQEKTISALGRTAASAAFQAYNDTMTRRGQPPKHPSEMTPHERAQRLRGFGED